MSAPQSQPAPNPVTPSKRSPFRILIYFVLAAAALGLFLQYTGMAEVAKKNENNTIIDRPHAE